MAPVIATTEITNKRKEDVCIAVIVQKVDAEFILGEICKIVPETGKVTAPEGTVIDKGITTIEITNKTEGDWYVR